jgi:hypothetical protein
MWKWLRYSGFSVILTGNPLHWRWIPVARKEPEDIWQAAHNWTAGWLFLTLRVYVDDGSW